MQNSCLIALLLLSSPIFAQATKNAEGFHRLQQKTFEAMSADKNPHQQGPTEAPSESQSYYGVVVEFKDSGGYTYMKISSGDKSYWAATSKTDVKVGDNIRLDEAFPMHGFHAKSLNRTFDMILFASGITKAN